MKRKNVQTADFDIVKKTFRGFILHLQTNVHSYILKYFVTVCDLICVMRTIYRTMYVQDSSVNICGPKYVHIEKSVSPCHCHMRKHTYTTQAALKVASRRK